MSIHQTLQDLFDAAAGEVRLRVKVVPGASRTRIAGTLGDRLKISVAAPAHGNQANRAVVTLLAKTFGLHERDVAILTGHQQPRKTVRLDGVSACAAVEKLAAALPDHR